VALLARSRLEKKAMVSVFIMVLPDLWFLRAIPRFGRLRVFSINAGKRGGVSYFSIWKP